MFPGNMAAGSTFYHMLPRSKWTNQFILKINPCSGSAVVDHYKAQNVVTWGSLLATAVWLQGALSTIVYPAQLCEKSGFKMYCCILWCPITFCDIMQFSVFWYQHCLGITMLWTKKNPCKIYFHIAGFTFLTLKPWGNLNTFYLLQVV